MKLRKKYPRLPVGILEIACMLVNRCLKYVAVTIGNILSDLRKDVSKV